MTDNQLISKKCDALCLIGYPIAHSKSPALFKAAYPHADMTYGLIEENTLARGMERFLQGGYAGANITAPFKDEIFRYITRPDRISALLQSANIILRKGEEIESYNSDYYGVRNTLEQLFAEQLRPAGANDREERRIMRSFTAAGERRALVIGAGGAGKAAALALNDLGIKVFLANRSREKTMEFLQAAPVAEYIPLHRIRECAGQCGLIVYALSFAIPEMAGTDLRDKIVFEANYGHPNLLPENVSSGTYLYLSGKYWLYNQAVPAFKLFTGLEPDTEAMWEIL